MSVLATYRQVLRNGPLTRLLIGEFVSAIGDWLYLVALVVLIYRETGDPVVLGIIGAARLLPYLFLSIPAGVVADRFDRRLVLLVSDLARAACMVGMAASLIGGFGVVPVAILALVATCFATLFYPAMGALLPSLARDEAEFGPANSLAATFDNAAWIVGPGIAGVILAAGSIELAFILNAISFGVVAIVLWTLPKRVPGKTTEPATVEAAAVASGQSDPASDPEFAPEAGRDPQPGPEPDRRILGRRIPASINLRAVVGIVVFDAMSWLTFGGMGILIVVLAVDTFHGGEEATGYLNVATGVGGVLGAVLSGVLVLRPKLGPPLLVAGLAFGAAIAVLGVAPGLVAAFIAITVASVAALVLDVARTTIFQRIIPDAYRGRFTGLLSTSQSGAEALGTLVVPILAALFGVALTLGALGVAIGVVTIGSLAVIAGAGDVAPGPFDADLRRIARLPLFAGMSAARIEGALRKLEPIRVEAGTAVIRQGDPADRFYVIGSGNFEVTRDGRPGGLTGGARVLRRDDVFGERGLIGRVPRTATITALEPGLLFAMDGPDFLALVGSRRGMAERFLDLYGTHAEA